MRAVVTLGIASLVLVACGESTAPEDRPQLSFIEITAGDAQSAAQGEWLPDYVHAQAIVEGGGTYFGTVHVSITSGNGGVELGGSRGEGNGVTLAGPQNSGFVLAQWKMGPASESQELTFWALRAEGDTVRVVATAESLPPAS